jgi:2-phospho-L-lactate guanylyltransferase
MLTEAKSRLAPHLARPQRVTLVLDMLHHVVGVLRESGTLEAISVVSPDPLVLEQAQAWGAQALMEAQSGHNPALHAAALHEMAAGATALLTISADLPLLDVDDIRSMIEQSSRYDVVLAPSWEGTGTNALLVRPPLALPYLFGPGSLQRYQAEARRRGLGSTLYTSVSTALDVDTINELEAFQRYELARKEARAS